MENEEDESAFENWRMEKSVESQGSRVGSREQKR